MYRIRRSTKNRPEGKFWILLGIAGLTGTLVSMDPVIFCLFRKKPNGLPNMDLSLFGEEKKQSPPYSFEILNMLCYGCYDNFQSFDMYQILHHSNQILLRHCWNYFVWNAFHNFRRDTHPQNNAIKFVSFFL